MFPFFRSAVIIIMIAEITVFYAVLHFTSSYLAPYFEKNTHQVIISNYDRIMQKVIDLVSQC